ncbi:MAG TPA: lipopolysaccharide heptosyltransferase II [Candidatus Binatia bacterium]|nr:lipopolysaccharide heptosyltransferase II [Candidatus Binatia bacterium]
MAEICWDNVLVLQTSFLGDTVLTLPLIAEIRRRFPVKRLSVLCLPLSRDLLQDHPAIDEIIVDDKRKTDRGLAGVRRKAAALRACGFTLALTPHKSLRSAMMLALAGIPNRVGFRESHGWFLFHHLAQRDPTRHDVERNLSVLQALGVSITECRRDIEFPVSPASQESVNQKLKAFGIADDKLLIGINPGSIWPTKRWAPSGFAELIQMLREKFDCQIVIFGGADDKDVVDAVQSRCGGAGISLAGRIDLRELPAAISRCAVFVTNDSGPMHVAVGRKVPTVAIFCATTPSLGFYPYTDNAIVVEKALSCRPCASHGGRRCPLGTEDCIRQIGSAKVLAAVEELLRSARSRLASSVESFQPRFMLV